MFTTDTNDTFSLLLMFVHRLVVDGFKKEGPKAISIPQIKVLYMINVGKIMYMKDIADILGIKPPSATSLVNGLVAHKYLRRVSDPHDRRAVRLEVTTLGEKILKDDFLRMKTRTDVILSRLSSSDKKELTRILLQLSDVTKTN